MTPMEAGYLAIQLKKARKSKKPYFFWFVREGQDGKPVLVVERKAEEAKTKGKRAKATAKNNKHVEGRIEALDGGKVGFYGEGQVTSTQMGRDFREKLAKVKELKPIAELFKGAEIGDLADAPSMAEEDEDVRKAAGRMSTQEDDEDEDTSDDGPTKADWVRESGAAKELYLAIKAKFGEESEPFLKIKEAQQAAISAKNKSFAEGIAALASLMAMGRTLLGLEVPPAWNWEEVGANLQMAKKATKPFWFWFCRQGEDDLPILIVERKAQEMRTKGKDARRVAQKKKAISGWIAKNDKGDLVFYAEGDELPFTQVERDFKQKLAGLAALSTVAPLLRGATFITIDTTMERPPEDPDEDEVSGPGSPSGKTAPGTEDKTAPRTELDSQAPDAPIELVRERLGKEQDEAIKELLTKDTPESLRYPTLLGLWNESIVAFANDVNRLVDEVEGSPTLQSMPQGKETIALIESLEEFYTELGEPLDEALEDLAKTGDESKEPVVRKLAESALKQFKSKPELEKLEKTSLGSPALYSKQVSFFETLITSLS